MNSKLTFAALLFAALNVCTFAARAEAAQPDIQKVLSSSHEATDVCGLVSNHLTYLDAKGERHVLDYLTAEDNCHNQNG
ncbi:DUF2790 domain-containing protein [Pseudomonas sp. NPDC090202]|uniref:DUF2790 domain-containing protein n=1 Tax=unclassified Pseudomonas TaxID=196821 RepID=UPI00381B6693